MVIINPQYKKLDTETDYEYGLRLISIKVEEKPDDLDWADIVDLLNLDCHRDSLRKAAATTDFSGYKVMQYYKEKFATENSDNVDDYLKELEDKKRQLERAKIQFRDERNAWQKQNYIDARIEQKLDYLEGELLNQGRCLFEQHEAPNINSDNDLLIQISDLHLGLAFSSTFGEYNPDIAKTRMNDYLNNILIIQKRHNSQNAICVLQGDLISGSIHKSIQLQNRENVIEQIKLAIELVSSFCYELTNHFQNVQLYNVSGNHTRLDRKEDSIHDERLDDLIAWDVARTLSHIDNFHCMSHRNIDSGIADIVIRNRTYIAVHGDFDKFSKSGVANLCMMIGFVPEAILYGHLHHCSYNEEQGVKMIRSGSLSGCGDDYTVEKRLIGNPSQMVSVCDRNGVVCCYPINLR